MNKNTRISITEARKEFLNFPEIFEKNKDLKSIIITKRGEPVLDVVPHGYMEAIIETLEIMSDPDQLKALKQSIKDVEMGRLYTIVGIRKEGDKNDVYSLAKKLFKAGLLE